MYIESMVIDKGTVSIRSPQALKITFYPNRTKLLPVVTAAGLTACPHLTSGRTSTLQMSSRSQELLTSITVYSSTARSSSFAEFES